jgi:hypothetical protein
MDFMKFIREVMPLKVSSVTYFFNPAASTIPKWQILKLLRWMQNMNQSMWDHEMFYADRSARNEQHLLRQL